LHRPGIGGERRAQACLSRGDELRHFGDARPRQHLGDEERHQARFGRPAARAEEQDVAAKALRSGGYESRRRAGREIEASVFAGCAGIDARSFESQRLEGGEERYGLAPGHGEGREARLEAVLGASVTQPQGDF
jgi:hypothetical protein